MADCCDIPEPQINEADVCRFCGSKGKPVQRITPESLLVEGHVARLVEAQYFFCPTAACEVVYYSNRSRQYFAKLDMKIRVGIKETEDPIPVCYCFDLTRQKIFDEIERTGGSTAASYITQKVQAGACACEIKNPSGRCCLGQVNRTVKQAVFAFNLEGHK